MRVLSLYDGISCGMVALERAGMSVERYDAFEIDKYAIKISEKNSTILRVRKQNAFRSLLIFFLQNPEDS